jgi:hypothetical protein
LAQNSDLAKLIAYEHVKKLAECDSISPDLVKETENRIFTDIETFNKLINNHKPIIKEEV